MQWHVKRGDILDIPADVLICSGNVWLNLSGGVGGAILLRYGPEMQHELHRYLENQKAKHVAPGEVVVTTSCGTPYLRVVHAVAIDAFYQTNVALVQKTLQMALAAAAATSAGTVALAALATGYGHMNMSAFADALRPCLAMDFPPIQRVVIGLRSASDVDELITECSEIALLSAN